MKFSIAASVALLAVSPTVAHSNNHFKSHERRHVHEKLHRHRAAGVEEPVEVRSVAEVPAEKRTFGGCQFPTDAGLVAVTPNAQNAGWAMSPDQPCLPGSFCPYACPPGQLMAQWDPLAIAYSYPLSMNGGLYCDILGIVHKPFPLKPYCVDGVGSVGCLNEAGGVVSMCQTVLPGNEAMLIPTTVVDWMNLAVPDTSYWAGTAAHYYINPPGTDAVTGCVWGTSANPIGNWSPYVAGANTDSTGMTFMKIGWNPIYLEPATPFRNQMPNWGVRIECVGTGCVGLPCSIDPAVNGVNEMTVSGGAATGAGGATFCVVTVPKGQKANIVIFGGSSSGKHSSSAAPSSTSSTPTSSSASYGPWSASSGYYAPQPTYSPHAFVEVNYTQSTNATASSKAIMSPTLTQHTAASTPTQTNAASALQASVWVFVALVLLGWLVAF